MDQYLVIAIIAVAIAYLGWRGWQFVARRRGCGSADCACHLAKPPAQRAPRTP